MRCKLIILLKDEILLLYTDKFGNHATNTTIINGKTYFISKEEKRKFNNCLIENGKIKKQILKRCVKI